MADLIKRHAPHRNLLLIFLMIFLLLGISAALVAVQQRQGIKPKAAEYSDQCTAAAKGSFKNCGILFSQTGACAWYSACNKCAIKGRPVSTVCGGGVGAGVGAGTGGGVGSAIGGSGGTSGGVGSTIGGGTTGGVGAGIGAGTGTGGVGSTIGSGTNGPPACSSGAPGSTCFLLLQCSNTCQAGHHCAISGLGGTCQPDTSGGNPPPPPSGGNPPPPPQAADNPMTIQGYKVVMPGNQNIAPAAGQTVTINGLPTTANPYTLRPQANGTYVMKVTTPAGYTAGYTRCDNRIDCHTGAITQGDTVTISGVSGFVDLWWHFTPNNNASCTGGALCDGTPLTTSAAGTVVCGKNSQNQPVNFKCVSGTWQNQGTACTCGGGDNDTHVTIKVVGASGAVKFHSLRHSFGTCNQLSGGNGTEFTVSGSKTCDGFRIGPPDGVVLVAQASVNGVAFSKWTVEAGDTGGACNNVTDPAGCTINKDSGSVTVVANYGSTCAKKGQGDANCDDKIDLRDFEIWRSQFITQQKNTGEDADFDAKNGVSIADFDIWRGNFAP